MSVEILGAFVVFAAVTLFTPGPNNLMLLSTGLNFGLRRAVPHIFGVSLGFGAMVLIVGVGLGAVFAAYPFLYRIIQVLGIAYLLYLAWVIATSGQIDSRGGSKRPISFLQAVAFQWVNAKGWTMAVGGMAAYATLGPYPWNAVAMAVVFGCLGTASSVTWVVFGTGLRRLLNTPWQVRAFNIAMGILLVASVVPVVFNGLVRPLLRAGGAGE